MLPWTTHQVWCTIFHLNELENALDSKVAGMANKMSDLKDRILAFREERDWKQFHKPKDLALALGIEASELSELFLWKDNDKVEAMAGEPDSVEAVADELADVLIYAVLLADHFDIDLLEAAGRKLDKNSKKYPVAKSKGNAKKYTELD
jgi:NTP pyrophosphatase (non-canonical NTP hydrolase)